MGTGRINVWIREPNDCTVWEVDGYAGAPIKRLPSLVNHAKEIKIPEATIKELVELL